MLIALAQLAPLALLLHLAPAPAKPVAEPARAPGLVASYSAWSPTVGPFDTLGERFREDIANQVRIEQHLQIRIIPHAGPVPMDLEIEETREETREIANPRFVQTKPGKCIPASNFATVAPGTGRRLFLFTRDNRIFSALLERGCEGRDYYSGFYLAPSPDAKLCVDRDRLLSRAGANCRLKQLRELIEVGD